MSSPVFFLLGASHHTTPLELREKLALTAARLPAFHQAAAALPGMRELAVLNTCNRVEFYGTADSSETVVRLRETFCDFQGFPPDAFAAIPLGGNAVEVSRVIARHEKAALQDLVQWQLFALMLAYIPPHGLGRTFAIIEPWLERHLRGIIALERIGDVRYVAHYLDYNVPIEIDIPESTVCVDARNDSFIAAFQAADPGLAYFGRAPRRSSEPERVDA